MSLIDDRRALPERPRANALGLLWVAFSTLTVALAAANHPSTSTLVTLPLIHVLSIGVNYAFVRLASTSTEGRWELVRCLANGPIAFAEIAVSGGFPSPVWMISASSVMGTSRESTRTSLAVTGATIACHVAGYLTAGVSASQWTLIAGRSAALVALCIFFRILLELEQQHRDSAEHAGRAAERARALKHEAEARFRLAEQNATHSKMASLGLLAASAAHEINNPINTIINAAQILLDGDAAGDREHFQHLIIAEGERIARVVGNLLQFARGGAEDFGPTNLQRVIEKTLLLVNFQLEKDRIGVDLDLPRDLPPVRARMEELQQVFLNLLTNARYALLEKRRQTPSAVARITISARRGGDERDPVDLIRVADNGTGIASEHLPRLFEPFFTTKPKDEGTGLGLSVCQRIVKEHRGRIEVESRPGGGTTFTVTLPAVLGGTLEMSTGSHWRAVM